MLLASMRFRYGRYKEGYRTAIGPHSVVVWRTEGGWKAYEGRLDAIDLFPAFGATRDKAVLAKVRRTPALREALENESVERVAKMAPTRGPSMSAANSHFLAMADHLRSIAEAMRRCSDVEVLSFVIHPAATDAQVDSVAEKGIPQQLTELACSCNGAELSFRWHDREKSCVREGSIRIPTLQEYAELRTHEEIGPCWTVTPETSQAHVYLIEESGDVFLVGLEDGYARSNELPLSAALDAMVACFGLPNWELTLYEHWFDDDDPEELDELEDAVERLKRLLRSQRP
jgi:hypothetical protein